MQTLERIHVSEKESSSAYMHFKPDMYGEMCPTKLVEF